MGLDLTSHDVEKPNSGGLPKPGKCHLLVVEVEDHGEYVSAVHEIIAHEDAGEVGKTTFNSFQTSGKGARRLQSFIEATGIASRQEIIDAKAAGQTVFEPDFSKAEGKTYFGTLVESEYEGKKRCKVEWDFFSPGDPQAAEYPCNKDYVKFDKSSNGKPATPQSNDDCPF